MKDDSGSYAVLAEQGSSASQMTTAKVMDIISRLPGCAGQPADAVSAFSQEKMEDAPKSLNIPKSECPDILIRLPLHKWPKSWSSMEDPVVSLERNLYGHLSYLCMWMTSKLAEKKQTLIRCGKYSTKKSIYENHHLSLIMYTWAAL